MAVSGEVECPSGRGTGSGCFLEIRHSTLSVGVFVHQKDISAEQATLADSRPSCGPGFRKNNRGSHALTHKGTVCAPRGDLPAAHDAVGTTISSAAPDLQVNAVSARRARFAFLVIEDAIGPHWRLTGRL